MNTVPSKQRHASPSREAWLASLAPLVSPGYPAEAAAALHLYLRVLDDVALEAFNRDTLEQAARCARGRHPVPTYAELRGVLDAWLREHRPVRAALPPPCNVVPESERCTPEQAAEVLRRHGCDGRRFAERGTMERGPVPVSLLTAAQLAQARRRAGIRVPAGEVRG